jgi:hypothetical protein
VRGCGLERFQLFGLEEDVLVFGELVALDDVFARNDTSCCLTRAPSFLWIWLKDNAAFDSAAE